MLNIQDYTIILDSLEAQWERCNSDLRFFKEDTIEYEDIEDDMRELDKLIEKIRTIIKEEGE